MPGSPAGSKDTKEKDQQLLQNILAEYATTVDRLAAWQDQTGKSERAFYRRLREVQPDSLTLSESVSCVSTKPPLNGHRHALERCVSSAPIAARTNVTPAALFPSEIYDRGGPEPPERLAAAAPGVRLGASGPDKADTPEAGEIEAGSDAGEALDALH